MMRCPTLIRAVLPVILAAFAPAVCAAQQGGMSQGLTANRDQPVKIESKSLEVRDKSRMATFIGNVKMTQGDTTVQCKTLVVYYEDSSSGSKGGAGIASPSGGKQSIKRMEAKGNVIVTQKEQTASGDNGLFDVKSNSVTLIGNVVVTQGQNVLNGERMTVDLNTGLTRVESSGGGPVKGLFYPNQPQKDSKPAPHHPAGPSAAGQPPRSSGPMRLN
jgi:lipopolysaccharide export system protein LptA